MLVYLRRSVIICPHLPGLLRVRVRLRRHRGRPAALRPPGQRVDHRQRVHPHRPELGRHRVPRTSRRQLRVPRPTRRHRPLRRRRLQLQRKELHASSGGDNPLVANGVSGESGATNLGPRSQTLLDNTKQLIAYWHALGVDNPTPDLVTTSGSGYDPDITPQDAIVQIPMVAKATGIAPAALRALISKHTNSAQLGFLGSKYIVVLQLNEALAKLH